MLIIGNGMLVSLNARTPFIGDGAVCVDGGSIADYGGTAEIKSKYKDAQFLDAKGNLIMPAFINSHHHIYSAFARGMNLDGPASKNFTQILENLWWRLDKKLSLEDIELSAYTTLIDCIKNGVTTIIDHNASQNAITGSLFKIAEIADILGIRACLCYETTDRDGKAARDEGILENINFIDYANSKNNNMIKGMFGLHASFTLSDESLKKCTNSLPKGVGFHIHAAEGEKDQIDSIEKYGVSAIKRLYDRGILRKESIAVHCVYADEKDLDIIANSGAMVAHNPQSNMGNAVGAPNAVGMIDRGILLGLGTDGYTSDMTESLKAANILMKHSTKDPSQGFSQSMKMLFENNHQIANVIFKKPIGKIEIGASADLIIADYEPPTPINAENYQGHLLFGLSGAKIDTTICNGRILMKNRQILIADEKEIYIKARAAAKRLWQRI